MGALGRWSLGTGLVLTALAVVCAAVDVVPVATIAGILAIVAWVVAGYDAVYRALERRELRRRADRARRAGGDR
ncbi:hypothetical protein GCM10009718_08980 [Isoptericola halotolerans]|uniref:Uncharacterized protein n=1 Tax=Isoptericola halotolerans TaxID=300560 RepID=A0ABX1ZZZ3_9MICO|nr:hypothetical protein [Isoptericola halotolerans]NOV96179.1 hypothetical protein [Isoptericola halotolerans]